MHQENWNELSSLLSLKSVKEKIDHNSYLNQVLDAIEEGSQKQITPFFEAMASELRSVRDHSENHFIITLFTQALREGGCVRFDSEAEFGPSMKKSRSTASLSGGLVAPVGQLDTSILSTAGIVLPKLHVPFNRMAQCTLWVEKKHKPCEALQQRCYSFGKLWVQTVGMK